MKKKLITTLSAAALMATSLYADLPTSTITFPRDLGGHLSNTAYDNLNIFEYWHYTGKLESVTSQNLSYSCSVFAAEFPLPNGDVMIEHWAHIIVIDQDKSLTYSGQTFFDKSSVRLSNEELDLNYDDQFILKNYANGIEQISCKVYDSENSKELELALFTHPTGQPVMLMNDNGVIDMPDGGNSLHYAKPDLPTSGVVKIGSDSYTINSGASTSWATHQWGDFFPTQHGWDWFAITLENGIQAMLFLHADKERNIVGGTVTVTLPDGTSKTFNTEDITYEKLNYWTSPKYGCTYPLSYLVSIPEIDLSLEINAKFAEQEVDNMFDGIANVKATYTGEKVEGSAAMNINIME